MTPPRRRPARAPAQSRLSGRPARRRHRSRRRSSADPSRPARRAGSAPTHRGGRPPLVADAPSRRAHRRRGRPAHRCDGRGRRPAVRRDRGGRRRRDRGQPTPAELPTTERPAVAAGRARPGAGHRCRARPRRGHHRVAGRVAARLRRWSSSRHPRRGRRAHPGAAGRGLPAPRGAPAGRRGRDGGSRLDPRRDRAWSPASWSPRSPSSCGGSGRRARRLPAGTPPPGSWWRSTCRCWPASPSCCSCRTTARRGCSPSSPRSVASDVGGYTAGVLFGKHPMAPSISPKKSWEGFAGSVVACMLVGALHRRLVLDGPWWGGLLRRALAVSATIGDLGESLIKRDLGIKDMGNLLPGHGGLMDRLDSLLPSAAVAYLLLSVLAPRLAQPAGRPTRAPRSRSRAGRTRCAASRRRQPPGPPGRSRPLRAIQRPG